MYVEIYSCELLKPAHKTKPNHGYLVLRPEERGGLNRPSWVSSLDDVVDEITKLRAQVDIEFPNRRGILKLEGKTMRYWPVHEDYVRQIGEKLKSYK